MGVFIDITGQRFINLTVISFSHFNKNRHSVWHCLCSCGKKCLLPKHSLISGRTRSCGCLNSSELRSKRKTTHSLSKHKLYKIYQGIKQRTSNPNEKAYKYYGGRGIKNEWLTFISFYKWSIKNGYQDGLTIERKDVNGNYCSANCCWIPKKEQSKNQRRSIKLKTGVLWRDIAIKNGVNISTFYSRLKRGYTYSDAASKPVKKFEKIIFKGESPRQASLKLGLSPNAVRERIKWGWSIKKSFTTPKLK